MQVIAKQGQWLGDVAVRESGSIEAIVEMAIRNSVAITDKIVAGTAFLKPSPINRRVMNYYEINGIYPATGADAMNRGGIGYMGVEINFTVS
ncbi:MAG: hypothetical protein LBE91_14780 [Tannerella sp.]|jgi:hypothetical protein|nr:hypothetical protein [Tannerella sp.]